MFIRKLLAVLCLATFAAFFPIHSKIQNQPQVNTYNTTNGIGGIEIQGEIDEHTADVVKEAFGVFEKQGFKSVVIHLNSPGGSLDAGADIVKEMFTAENDYDMKVSTYVDHGEYCASMCTGIFAAGNFRVAAWDATWVFHSPFVKLTDEEKANPNVMKEVELTNEAARKFMMSLYEFADAKWADEVLKPHIMKPDYPIKLTTVQIIDQSPWFIDYVLDDAPKK